MWNKWKTWLSTTSAPAPDPDPYPMDHYIEEMKKYQYASQIATSQQAQNQYWQQMQNIGQQMGRGMGGFGIPSTTPRQYAFDLGDLAVREALRRMRDYLAEVSNKRTMRELRQQITRRPYAPYPADSTGKWYSGNNLFDIHNTYKITTTKV